MSPASYDLSISAARADALFVSALQRSDQPSARQVRQAIAAAIAAYGGLGCAARVAQPSANTRIPRPPGCAGRVRWSPAYPEVHSQNRHTPPSPGGTPCTAPPAPRESPPAQGFPRATAQEEAIVTREI